MYRIFRFNRACAPLVKGGIRLKEGFTLLELLITVVLASVMLTAIWTVYNAGFKTFYAQGTRSGIKADAGRWMINMPAELRTAGVLTTAQQNSLAFTLDADSNGVDEAVQYGWSGVSGEPLNRTAISTVPAFNITAMALNSVNALNFTYYDANNTLLSFPVTASQARMVAINLTVSDNDETFHLRSNVRLRNL